MNIIEIKDEMFILQKCFALCQ